MTDDLKIEIDIPEKVNVSRVYEIERRINGEPDKISMFLLSKEDMEQENEDILNLKKRILNMEVHSTEVLVKKKEKNSITFRSILSFLGLSFT